MCDSIISQNRIRELRKEHHMTQVRLAIELEVTQETISAYESGKHFPSVSALLRLMEIFHASSDYIIGVSDIRNPYNPSLQTEAERLFYTKFRKLDLRRKDILLAYMDGLIDSSHN